MNVFIGSDHAGFELKESLLVYLRKNNISVEDKGTFSSESTDYPDYAHFVAKSVENKENALGILICGSANGVCMTANKHESIRAAIAWRPDIAGLARAHNDANIVCIPARFVSETDAQGIVSTFLGAVFEGGRHQKRVEKIAIC